MWLVAFQASLTILLQLWENNKISWEKISTISTIGKLYQEKWPEKLCWYAPTKGNREKTDRIIDIINIQIFCMKNCCWEFFPNFIEKFISVFVGKFLPKIYVVRLRYRVVKLVLVAVFQWLQTSRSTIINRNIAKSVIRSFKI